MKVVRGQGMPSFRHHDMGNLYIQFEVKFPDPNWTADPAAFEQLRAILPPPTKTELPADAMADDVYLEDPSMDQKARARGELDEDEDDGPQRGEPQCVPQ
jgi:DnaJ family protein A protein 2